MTATDYVIYAIYEVVSDAGVPLVGATLMVLLFLVLHTAIRKLAGRFWRNMSIQSALQVGIAGFCVLTCCAFLSYFRFTEPQCLALAEKLDSALHWRTGHSMGIISESKNPKFGVYDMNELTGKTDQLRMLTALEWMCENFALFVVAPAFVVGFVSYSLARQETSRKQGSI